MIVRLLLVAVLTLCASCAGKDEQMPYTVNTMELQYGPHALDATLYIPGGASGTNTFPGAVALHPGGWSGGARADIDAHCRALCARGTVVLNIEYTLANAETQPSIEKTFDDIEAALLLVRSWSCVQGKPVSLVGFSAGGHLSGTYCAYRLTVPDRLVMVSAPVDLREWDVLFHPTMVYLLGEHEDWADALEAYSPLLNPAVPGIRQLSIWGGLDPALNYLSRAEYMTVLGGMPASGGVLLADAGHLMEGQMTQWAAIVSAWIGSPQP